MKRTCAFLGAFIGFLIPAAVRAADYKYPFQNPDLPMEQRITNLLGLMTLDEKITCFGNAPSVPRLGVVGTRHLEGLHGAEFTAAGQRQSTKIGGPAGNAAGAPGAVNRGGAATQPGVNAATQPGARAGARRGGGNGGAPAVRVTFATTFCQEIGMGETWDAPLIGQAAEEEGIELRYGAQNPTINRSAMVLRGPNSDLGRDPRWGRTEECFGEDAFFNGSMVVAFVKGLQGNDPHYLRAAALMKHFLANSNEDTRTTSSSDFDTRLFWEYYSYPFRVGIQEANAQGFMASYNSYNGIPMTVHPVLQDIVRKQWGFDGIICSDGSAVQLMFNPQPRGHGYFYTLEEAAAASVRASVGQFLDAQAQQTLVSAVQHNILTERDLDEALRPVFRVMIRLGLLDPPDNNPYAKIGDGPEPWTLDSSKALAKKVTEESVVLLKNANNTLPLDKSKIKSVAMIGTRANVVRFDWYSSQPGYTITPVEGIQAKLGSNVKVSFASSDDVDAAVNLAKSSDVAICVVGNDPICDAPWAKTESPNEGKESVDRKGIDLDEEPLVKKVFAANPHTIVVLISSFPYAINWTQENIPAIVHMTHCSQEEGSALADVLFGDYNPAGRLVETWPKSLSQIPDLMDYDIRHGRTYMYFKGEPLYAFGYGLSYTNFEYSNLKSADTLAPDGTLDVSVDVKNTGSRDGDEVVQLYVKHIGSGVLRPNKELKGFARVPLKAGETKTVKLQLPAAKLAYWNTTANQWVVERDQVQLMVGTSSADLKLNKTIQITP